MQRTEMDEVSVRTSVRPHTHNPHTHTHNPLTYTQPSHITLTHTHNPHTYTQPLHTHTTLTYTHNPLPNPHTHIQGKAWHSAEEAERAGFLVLADPLASLGKSVSFRSVRQTLSQRVRYTKSEEDWC